MRKIIIFLAIVISCLIFFHNRSQAALLSISLEKAVKSYSIAIGTVEETETRNGKEQKTDDGRIEKTENVCSTIIVEKYIKNDLKNPKIVICFTRYLGLEDNFPYLEAGKKYLFFFNKRDDMKACYSIANFIIEDGMVRNYAGQFKGGNKIPLDNAINQIQELLKTEK